jgi:hypothetical protein
MLEQEFEYFNANRQELLKHHENQFVLIKGNEKIGAYTTEAEAYKAGIEKFGNVPLLIKQVLREEKPVYIPILNLGIA